MTAISPGDWLVRPGQWGERPGCYVSGLTRCDRETTSAARNAFAAGSTGTSVLVLLDSDSVRVEHGAGGGSPRLGRSAVAGGRATGVGRKCRIGLRSRHRLTGRNTFVVMKTRASVLVSTVSSKVSVEHGAGGGSPRLGRSAVRLARATGVGGT